MKTSPVEIPSQSSHTQFDPPNALSLLSLWRILWGRKWTIAIVAFLFAVAGFLITSFGARTFTTETLLVLEDNNAALSSALSRDGGAYGNPSQAVQVFGSREVIAQVVDDLGLIEDPEFNPFLAQAEAELTPSLPQRAVQSVAALFGQAPSDAAPTPQALPQTLVRQSTVRAVQARIRFLSDPQSTIIRVLATTQSPPRSAELANAVAEAFLQELLETRLESVDRVAEQLGRRVSALRQNVRERETALQDFLNSTDGFDRNSLTALSDEAQRIRIRLSQFEQERLRAQALLDRLAEISAVPQDEQAALIAQNAELTVLAGPLSGGDVVAGLRQNISQRMDRDQRLVSGLQASLEGLEEQIAANSEQQLRFQQLEREVEATTEIYDFSVRRLNELLVQSGVESGGGRIVFAAEVPQLPDGRGRVRTAILLGILGFVTVVAWVLLRETTSQAVRTVTDLQHILPRQRIVAIPRAPQRRFFDGTAHKQRLLLSAKPTEYSEAVRRLRSTLIPKQAMQTGMVILTTSDFVTAGKSLLTLGLARSYALLGKKVLVIGADMRDMALARQLGQTASAVTLQTVLADRTALEHTSIRHAELEIDLLLPGPQSGSPADMFEGADFEALIALVRAEYDVVLVDAPPLLTAPDAALIAPYADRLVFVAGASASTAESVISAVEQLPNGLGQGNVVALYAAEDTSELRMRVQNRKFAKL